MNAPTVFAAQGACFGVMKDAVRFNLALGFIQVSSLSLAKTSETLRFSEISALLRVTHRWHG